MDLFQTIILGVVEGISEFLPISSTGHMVLAAALLHLQETEFVKSFEIIIQLGAILAIVVLYWRRLIQGKEIWKRVLAAFIPTGILGFLLYKVVKHILLGNDMITLSALFIGGIALIILELMYKEKQHHVDKIEKMSIRNAFWIGVFQSLAIIPGVSRSAATIISALFLGTKRQAAVEFSFLLAVPTMLAATGLDVVKTKLNFSGNELLMLLIGFVVSFVVALFVVKWFLKFVQTHTFIPFGVYRILMSLLFYFFIIK
jgi:undecaprenyl-diphosphatase